MKQSFLFHDLIGTLSDELRTGRLRMPSFDVERRPSEIWRQKIFCVLSSQFNSQRAAAITDGIIRDVPFFEAPLPLARIEEWCLGSLTKPGVGYRFPKLRAKQISLCWFPFAQVKDEYQEYISSFADEHKARREIVALYPGIGMKQASMFLRNIGASKGLAVIDIHLLFYLNICHSWRATQLTRKRYAEAEKLLLADAASYDIDLNVFDAVVWSAARAMKKRAANV